MKWHSNAGGESTADNCQILQTRVNRFKSDKDNLDRTELERFSCEVKFTGMEQSLFLTQNVKYFFFIYPYLLSWCAWLFDSKPLQMDDYVLLDRWGHSVVLHGDGMIF